MEIITSMFSYTEDSIQVTRDIEHEPASDQQNAPHSKWW